MGTGKTTIGKILAKELGYSFFDTDSIIEEEAGITIKEIFNQYGEARFREMEKAAVAWVSSHTSSVIATGGGVVLDPNNIKALSANGYIICLKSDPEAIHSRVSLNNERPLLIGEDQKKLIVERMEARNSLYNGDLNLDTSDLTPSDASLRILSFVSCNNKLDEMKLSLPTGSYKIIVGQNILNKLPESLQSNVAADKYLIVTSENIVELWGRKIKNILLDAGFKVDLTSIPDGENYKTFESVMSIHSSAIDFGLTRESAIIAVGGGVIGDMAGFVASTYMRGIKVVQIPTTLLSQVDSSIGGKTGINHPSGKNMIGTFYQPSLVFSDSATLTTLPKVELINGLAEVIKYGVILDKDLFSYLEENINEIISLNQNSLSRVVLTCSNLKRQVVENDEKESGLRALLNYGHTIGHGIETATNYSSFKHGEAISVGMDLAAGIAVKLGIMKASDRTRQRNLLLKAHLPISFYNIDISKILDAIMHDKKNTENSINFVLPTEIGAAKHRYSVSQEDIHAILENK